MLEARRLEIVEPFSVSRRLGACWPKPSHRGCRTSVFWSKPWKSGRPPGAPADWQPGAVLRLPFSQKTCRDGGVVCAQAVTGLADAAMMVACAAAWNGYRPMSPIDQTTHFLRPVTFDVVADARVVRIGRTTSFGRVMLYSAVDKRPCGMVASAYAIA